MKKYTYLVNFESQTLERVGESFAVKGDGGIAELEFAIPLNFGIPANQALWRVFFKLPGERESLFETLPAVAATESGDYVTSWTISKAVTQKAGRLAFSLAAISGNDIQWNSRTVIMQVPESQYQPESEEAEEPYTGRLTILEGDMAQIRGEFAEVQDDFEELKETATLGTPIPESLVANMTEGHVYVYTGTETGYTAGHLYYYVNGTLTDGGQYGGTTVDATLTQSGQAADAAVTGAEISAIKEDLSLKVSSVNGVKPDQDGNVDIESDGVDLINYIRLNVYNPDDEDVYVGGMLKENNTGYTANANWMVTGYIPVEPGVEYFLYQNGDKYSRRLAAYYDANKVWLSDYNFYNISSSRFIPPEGATYIRITVVKSVKNSMRVYRYSERYTYLLDTQNGGIIDTPYQQLYPISVTDEFVKAGRIALEHDFKETIQPENTDFLKVVGRYNILDYANAFKNVRWSDGDVFSNVISYSGQNAYPIIRLPLSEDPITLHGNHIRAIRLNSTKDGAMLLSFSSGTLPYGDTPRGFTITSSGITDITTWKETEIADIQFEESLTEVFLFVSGGSGAWMSGMADVNEYHPYEEKKVLIADNCKSSIVKQIFAESDDFSAQINTITKPLNGKILVMFGDSEMQYLSNYPEHTQAYKDYLGISRYRSYAIAGNKWETEESDAETDPTLVTTSIHAQLNSLLSDIENGTVSRDDIGAICWMMGTNCRAVGNIWVTEGSELNYNIQNMCGAANLFFKRLYTEFTDPNIRLMGIIPLQSQYRNDYFNATIKDRNDKLRTIHQIWSMPYLDGHREFNVIATGNLVDNGTQNDNVHWSPLGMKLAIRKICGKLVTV